MKHTLRQSTKLQLTVLLSLIVIGLSGFVAATANAQTSTTHYRDTTLATAIGRPTGTQLGCIDSDILWTSENGVWINNVFNRTSPQGDVSTRGHITVNGINYIYGLTQSDALMYTVNDGETWETVYPGGGYPSGHSPADATCLDHNGNLHWFTMDDRYIFEIVDGNLIEKLDISAMNSICSNMADTIYIARGSNGEVRGYRIDDWTQYADFDNNLEFGSSIDWKDNKLLVIDGLNVWSRSTNPNDSWTELVELDPSGQWAYCTWLVDASANQLDLAVGSATFDQIQVWRQIVAPTSEFSATPLTGTAPLEVQFTDESTGNPTEWLWDFGDGNTSTEQNPTHVYTEAGSFTVSLTASNNGGSDTETKVDYVSVNWLPMDANFTASPEFGIAPLEVQFTDLSTGNPTTWEWNFGDGGVSTLQNPEYTYTTPGEYTVTLTITGPGGSDTQEMVNLINVQFPAPVADFSGDPTGGTAPLDVNFISLSTGEIDTYSWDFGDGNTSTEMNPDHEFTLPGTYTVSLTVTGPGGDDEMIKENYIEVVEPLQVVITSFVGDPAGFISKQPWEGNFSQENGETASILSSLGNQYSVDFVGGNIVSTELTITGDDLLTLTVSGANGSDTQELLVPVFADHNLLSDTISNSNIQIYTSPTEVTTELIKYELELPIQEFYNLYNFTFQVANAGAGIEDITFETNGNTLFVDVFCNTTSNYQTFKIQQNESGSLWFQTGLLMLFPDAPTLEMLSENISTFVYPGEDLSTKIFTGAATNWTITNETYNEVVYTGTHSSIGITEKTIEVGSWTLGPILEQSMRIDVSNTTKTVSRTFLMDGTTGIGDQSQKTPTDQLPQVYPNPTNGQTTLTFTLSQKGEVKIEVLDIYGRKVQTIVSGEFVSGHHEIPFSTAALPAGIYLLKMTTQNFCGTIHLEKSGL